jgi:hypothetical protein
MAEVDSMMLADQHSDIRKEAVDHTNEIVREGLKEAFAIRGDVKDARFDVSERVGNQGDRITDRLLEHDAKVAARFFDVGRDTQDIRAQIIAQQQQIVAGFSTAAKDAEINALKTQVELAKQTTYLSDKIDDQSDRTRELINSLRNDDLNRALIERNTELVAAVDDGRRWRHRWDDGQYQALFSQLQNFQSQLQTTRQDMINFGTMVGTRQDSASNAVR